MSVTKGCRHEHGDQGPLRARIMLYPDQRKRPKGSKARSALPASLLNSTHVVVDDLAKRRVDRRQIAAVQLPRGELRRQLLQQRDPLVCVALACSPGLRTCRLDRVGSEGSSRPGKSLRDDLADSCRALQALVFDAREKPSSASTARGQPS